jgi:hypothetical protein
MHVDRPPRLFPNNATGHALMAVHAWMERAFVLPDGQVKIENYQATNEHRRLKISFNGNQFWIKKYVNVVNFFACKKCKSLSISYFLHQQNTVRQIFN